MTKDELLEKMMGFWNDSFSIAYVISMTRALDPFPNINEVAEILRKMDHEVTIRGMAGIFNLNIDGNNYDWFT